MLSPMVSVSQLRLVIVKVIERRSQCGSCVDLEKCLPYGIGFLTPYVLKQNDETVMLEEAVS